MPETKISDLVTIPADQFGKASVDVTRNLLNAKYANKVIPRVGLGISVYDILATSDGVVGHGGDGAANANVVFRLVVFRPFRGEVLIGQIGESSEEVGIRIRLRFFDDVTVPPPMLFDNCEFDRQERTWVWNNEGDKFYFDKHEWVRIRVEEEHWHEVAPVAPNQEQAFASPVRQSPYGITASMSQSGLGPINWW